MNNYNKKKAAKILFNARQHLKRIEKLPKKYTPKNTKEGYEIQNELSKLYFSFNKSINIVGKKIGCTNLEAQKQINIDQPFYGNIFSNHFSQTGSLIQSNDFFSPFIEPEFSFKIKEDIRPKKHPYSREEIIQMIHSVIPSIEIVDSRFNDWTKVGINNLIADNGAHAHWIIGKEKKNLKDYNLNDHKVDLYINKKIVKKGNSYNVLENPINSLIWLINNSVNSGVLLKKNQYVSTGTCTPAIPIKKGNEILADFGKLGKVSFVYI